MEILLVEDNPGDVLLTREILSEGAIDCNLHVTKDGVEAMDFLHRAGAYSQAPRPDMILLDLNLPKKDGREVLAEVKQDPRLRRIPVLILTTSQSAFDIEKTYDLQANCYITKPVDLDEFAAVVRQIEAFWMTTAQLPAEGEGPVEA